MNKISKVTVLFVGLNFSANMAHAAGISPKLTCNGPGFDYAELVLNSTDVGLPTQASTLSLSHFFFELTTSLHKAGLIPASEHARYIKTNIGLYPCIAHQSSPFVFYCGAQETTIDVLNEDKSLIAQVKDANITLWTESKIAVDSLNEGLFAEVRITSPAIDPVSETITLSHIPDGGQYCTAQ